jgi:hypothetical protein
VRPFFVIGSGQPDLESTRHTANTAIPNLLAHDLFSSRPTENLVPPAHTLSPSPSCSLQSVSGLFLAAGAFAAPLAQTITPSLLGTFFYTFGLTIRFLHL